MPPKSRAERDALREQERAARGGKPKKKKESSRGAGAGDSGFTDEQMAEMREIFAMFDEDGSGSIDANELGGVMEALGVSVSKSKLEEMIREVDTPGGDGEIGFEEFLALMRKSDSNSDPRAEARAVFDRFDLDRSGSIEASELRQAIAFMAPDLSESAVEELIKVLVIN
jgi:Ca2+-binding EF-hand superfamily protein